MQTSKITPKNLRKKLLGVKVGLSDGYYAKLLGVHCTNNIWKLFNVEKKELSKDFYFGFHGFKHIIMAQTSAHYYLLSKHNGGHGASPFYYDRLPENTSHLFNEEDNDYDSFQNGLLKVRRDGKWGFINEFGREIIPCIYDDVRAAIKI